MAMSNPEIERMSGIYAFTCLPTGRQYVGSAVRLGNRKARHLGDLRRGHHKNSRFQRAFLKHGEAAFCFTVLLVCEPVDLVFYEQRAFDVLQPTINIIRLAGSSLGRKYTPEAYANILAGIHSQKGLKRSAETRARMSAAQKGRKRSFALRPKQSARKTGRPLRPEVIAKISAAKKGKSFSAAHRAKLSAAKIGNSNRRRTPDPSQGVLQF